MLSACGYPFQRRCSIQSVVPVIALFLFLVLYGLNGETRSLMPLLAVEAALAEHSLIDPVLSKGCLSVSPTLRLITSPVTGGHTSVRGIPRARRPPTSWEAESVPLPLPANAEPLLVVTGPSAYVVARPERCIATGVGDQVLDGVASERPATANTLILSM